MHDLRADAVKDDAWRERLRTSDDRENHAAAHVGHPALSPGANFALFDLRPFLKATS